MTTMRAIIALIALGTAGGAAWWVNSVLAERETLRAQNEALTLRVTGCEARAGNILEDKETDNEVDNLPDLGAVPDRWLLPPR